LGLAGFIACAALVSLLPGRPSRWLAGALGQEFGWGALFISSLCLLGGAALLVWEQMPRLRLDARQVIGLELALWGGLGLLHSPFPLAEGYDRARAGLGGGYFGWAILYGTSRLLGRSGAILFCLALVAAGACLLQPSLWRRISAPVRRFPSRSGQRRGATPQPQREDRAFSAPATAEAVERPAGPPTVHRPAGPVPRPHPPAKATPEPRPRLRPRSAKLPPLDLLAPASTFDADDPGTRYQAQVIEETLTQFGVPARVVEVQRGPTVTQFGVEPGFVEHKRGNGPAERRKVRVNRIVALSNDLALALSVPTIRVEAPVPGRPLVGIEVPNRKGALVNLRSVMEADSFRRLRSPLAVALGQSVAGKAAAADLAKMPHLLVAGATGSGKSVCVNALIACLLLQNSPEDLKLLLVDPKRVEMAGYAGVPHLIAPVVVEADQTVMALRWVCQEMDRRYKEFARTRVRNIEGYNTGAAKRKEPRLPYLCVFIDELADLMMVSPDEVERSICRLAQMGRATGIHMVIATQRPSVDVVTGLIKANFPARIAFAVSTQIDSRVILDAPGAEQLLGRGDMLFMSPEGNRLLRLQGCWVSDEELRAICDYWRQAAMVGGETTASTAVPWEGMEEESDEDTLLNQAIAIIQETRQASTSYLQRRLRVGYSRAARIMEQLEERGIIGPDPGGGRPRKIYIETAPAETPGIMDEE